MGLSYMDYSSARTDCLKGLALDHDGVFRFDVAGYDSRSHKAETYLFLVDEGCELTLSGGAFYGVDLAERIKGVERVIFKGCLFVGCKGVPDSASSADFHICADDIDNLSISPVSDSNVSIILHERGGLERIMSYITS